MATSEDPLAWRRQFAGDSERLSINIFKHLPQNLLEPKHISLLSLPGLRHPVISL